PICALLASLAAPLYSLSLLDALPICERFRHRGHGGDPRGHPARQPAPGAASRVYRRARFGRRVSHFVEEHAEQVRLAAERIHGRVRRTPTLTTDLDLDLRLKAECFQVTGSFKPRGAFNAIL